MRKTFKSLLMVGFAVACFVPAGVIGWINRPGELPEHVEATSKMNPIIELPEIIIMGDLPRAKRPSGAAYSGPPVTKSVPRDAIMRCQRPRDLVQGRGTVSTCEACFGECD